MLQKPNKADVAIFYWQHPVRPQSLAMEAPAESPVRLIDWTGLYGAFKKNSPRKEQSDISQLVTSSS